MPQLPRIKMSASSPSSSSKSKEEANRNSNAGQSANTKEIQQLLDENLGLINTIQEYQNLGKISECLCYQRILHRNLLYLMKLQKS